MTVEEDIGYLKASVHSNEERIDKLTAKVEELQKENDELKFRWRHGKQLAAFILALGGIAGWLFVNLDSLLNNLGLDK